jgi:tetratricopeptide (TPR) repeat protein
MEKEFDKIQSDGLSFQLDGNYTEAVRIFNNLVLKYPKEGSAIIRKMHAVYLGGERIRTAPQIQDYISSLDKAEQLIKYGESTIKMDKYNGMRDLFFLRGYFKSILGGAMKEYLSDAIKDFDKCLELDPNYQAAINLKNKSKQELR